MTEVFVEQPLALPGSANNSSFNAMVVPYGTIGGSLGYGVLKIWRKMMTQ